MDDWGRHPEGPDEQADGDLMDDREYVVAKCPNCGSEIYEDADRCNHCGHWVVHHTSIWEGRGVLWMVLAMMGIFAVIYLLIT